MTAALPPQPWMQDPATKAVMTALANAGGSPRFVGGCVRDTLVGRAVADIDIATPLTPPAVIAALEAADLRAVPTGIEHGTVTAISGRRPFEVTTLRRDVETDGRRAVVAFTTDWAEDAQRRDFRLNALYLDPEGRLYDPTGGGVADAHAGRIVFVGDAETRIREDYLRTLRFFRFLAWYGRGEPDAVALAACARLKDGLAGLSGERVSKEFLKLLAAKDPMPSLRLMQDSGILAVLLTGMDRLDRLESLIGLGQADPELRLAALARNPEAMAAAITRLRLSNAQAGRLEAALADKAPGLESPAVRAAIYRLGAQAVRDRIILAWAEHPKADARPRRAALDIAKSWSPPRLPVGGADAQALGIAPGPALGKALAAVEQWWIGEDFAPTREMLLERLATEARAAL